MPNTCHSPLPGRINHFMAAVPGNKGAPQAFYGGWGSPEPPEPPFALTCAAGGAVPLTRADAFMGTIAPFPPHTPSPFQGTAFPACHPHLLQSPTHIPQAPLGCSRGGVPSGLSTPPVPSAAERGPPPGPPETPALLPHAPLPRRPLLRSRGKSSFKNTSSKAPSVSGGGCRGRGGREGDAAALDTEVTGRGGGRGRRACTWARVLHTRVRARSTWQRESVTPNPRPASVSLPIAASSSLLGLIPALDTSSLCMEPPALLLLLLLLSEPL